MSKRCSSDRLIEVVLVALCSAEKEKRKKVPKKEKKKNRANGFCGCCYGSFHRCFIIAYCSVNIMQCQYVVWEIFLWLLGIDGVQGKEGVDIRLSEPGALEIFFGFR